MRAEAIGGGIDLHPMRRRLRRSGGHDLEDRVDVTIGVYRVCHRAIASVEQRTRSELGCGVRPVPDVNVLEPLLLNMIDSAVPV